MEWALRREPSTVKRLVRGNCTFFARSSMAVFTSPSSRGVYLLNSGAISVG